MRLCTWREPAHLACARALRTWREPAHLACARALRTWREPGAEPLKCSVHQVGGTVSSNNLQVWQHCGL